MWMYEAKTPVKLNLSPIVGICGHPTTDRDTLILRSIFLIFGSFWQFWETDLMLEVTLIWKHKITLLKVSKL